MFLNQALCQIFNRKYQNSHLHKDCICSFLFSVNIRINLCMIPKTSSTLGRLCLSLQCLSTVMLKPFIFHLFQMENKWLLGVSISKHIIRSTATILDLANCMKCLTISHYVWCTDHYRNAIKRNWSTSQNNQKLVFFWLWSHRQRNLIKAEWQLAHLWKVPTPQMQKKICLNV